MKKLTAGILASLIGLVSANSADAAVASKNYVDEGLATKQNVLADDVNVKKDPTASTGAFVTGISAVDGIVTVSYGDQAEVESATSEKAGVMKLYTTTGENIDGAMTQKAVTDELNLKQVKLTSTGDNANVVKDGTGAYITGVTAANGTITFSTGDVTFDTALNDTSVNGVQNKVIKAAIDLKQNELTSTGESANVKVTPTTDKDNVVTGISAANGVVNVTTGYFDHSNTEYEGVKDVAIVADTDNDGLQEVYTEYYGAEDVSGEGSKEEGWYVLMRKADATQPNGYKYQWELIDREYSETQPAQQ